MTTLNVSKLANITFTKNNDLGRIMGYDCSLKGITLTMFKDESLTRYTKAILVCKIGGKALHCTIDLAKNNIFGGIKISDREALRDLLVQLQDLANNSISGYNNSLQAFPFTIKVVKQGLANIRFIIIAY